MYPAVLGNLSLWIVKKAGLARNCEMGRDEEGMQTIKFTETDIKICMVIQAM